jgi:hypothetical protein
MYWNSCLSFLKSLRTTHNIRPTLSQTSSLPFIWPALRYGCPDVPPVYKFQRILIQSLLTLPSHRDSKVQSKSVDAEFYKADLTCKILGLQCGSLFLVSQGWVLREDHINGQSRGLQQFWRIMSQELEVYLWKSWYKLVASPGRMDSPYPTCHGKTVRKNISSNMRTTWTYPMDSEARL